MTVTARMRCHVVRDNYFKHQDGKEETFGKEVRLSPVYSSDPTDPNYSYSKATPAGDICLHINNPEAYEQFAEGKTYDITFEEHFAPATAD